MNTRTKYYVARIETDAHGPRWEFAAKCSARPTPYVVTEWTTDPDKARPFSYAVGRSVMQRSGALLLQQ